MNKLEFNTVLKVLGITHTDTKIYPKSEEYFYCYNDLTISFHTSKYYAVVSGKIPLEVANIIFEKYPDNPYKIRVNGGQDGWNPKDWCLGHNYINTYHIDTKEGLLIFFLETFDYQSRKNKLPENYSKLYQQFLNDISRALINEINPNISLDNWMKGAKKLRISNRDSYELYLEIRENEKNDIDKEIRKLLRKFDYAVNPFQRNDNWLQGVEDIFEKISVNAVGVEEEDGMKRENCAEIFLTDLNTGNYVNYSRNPDGFYYILNYDVSSGGNFKFYHYFSNHSFIDNYNGEFILLRLYKDNEFLYDMEYNLSTGVLSDEYKGVAPITLEQKQFIKEKLTQAINYASDITINKTKNKPKNKVKKLIK